MLQQSQSEMTLPILSVSAPNTAEDNGTMAVTVDIGASAFENFTFSTSTSSINPATTGNDYTAFTNAPYSIAAGQTILQSMYQ